MSPVLATVLMVIATVAASIMLYVTVMAIMGAGP